MSKKKTVAKRKASKTDAKGKAHSKKKPSAASSAPVAAEQTAPREVITHVHEFTDKGSRKELTRNVTLITTGQRSKVKGVLEKGSYAELNLSLPAPKDTEELYERWKKSLDGVKEYVYGGGDGGIVSAQFVEQVSQIADPAHVWYMSYGLGLVNLRRKYPQYDLSSMETDIRNYPGVVKGALSEKEWWMKVSGYGDGKLGRRVGDVMIEAIEAGHRVIVTLVSVNYYVLALDLATLLARMSEDASFATRVSRQVRLIGQGLETAVPPPLLPCVMPYDSVALDSLVPGVRVNLLRRAAFLLQNVAAQEEDGGSDPLNDADKLREVYAQKTSEPMLVYKAPSTATASRRAAINDDELADVVLNKYVRRLGRNPVAISRMMKHDGYSVHAERIRKVLVG